MSHTAETKFGELQITTLLSFLPRDGMQHTTHLSAVHAFGGIYGRRVAPHVLWSFNGNTVAKIVTSTGTLLSKHTHVHVLNVRCTHVKRKQTLMNMHFFRTPHFYTAAPARVQADLCAHNNTYPTPGTQSNGHNGEERRGACLFHLLRTSGGLRGGERDMHARTSHVSSALIKPAGRLIVHPKTAYRRSNTHLSDLEAPSKNTARHAPGVPARHQRRRNGVFLAELGAKI